MESFGLRHNNNFTIAGALFADGNQVYHSRVFCTRWNGLTKAHGKLEALDDKEYSGDLLYLLEKSLEFIEKHNNKRWKKENRYRVNLFDYPERAIQEAVVNALVHRDYAILGGEIQIGIYDDRIEIVSPGGMYDGSFIQDNNLDEIPSLRRNRIIADLFERLNFMERRGSGLKKIVEEYEQHKNYNENFKPKFHSTHSAFFVTLKNLNYEDKISNQNVGTNVGINVGINNKQKLSIKQRRNKIVNIIKQNQEVTASELSQFFSVNKRTIERDLSKLAKDKVVKYVGSKKTGKWVIIKELKTNN